MARFIKPVTFAQLTREILGIAGAPEFNCTLLRAVPLSKTMESSLAFSNKKLSDEQLHRIRQQNELVVLIPADGGVTTIKREEKAILIEVPNPRLAFVKALSKYAVEVAAESKIHPTSIVSPEARLGAGVTIGPYCVIGKAELGNNTILRSHVVIHDNVSIGMNCEVGEFTVIGKSGFGYERNDDGEWIHFPHFGGVVIEDNVSIGASTCIDQGVMSPTRIGSGTKIDNLVHIAHNVDIGKRNMIVACAEVSGSVVMGSDGWIGPNASILNNITIGDKVFVGIRALVVQDVPAGHRVTPLRDTLKSPK